MPVREMGLRDRDLPGTRGGTASDIQVVSSRWSFTLHVERNAAGGIVEAAVTRIDDAPDERKAAFLATMRKALDREQMMRDASDQQGGRGMGPAPEDDSLKAEAQRWARSLTSRQKREQFLHVRRTLKQHGPVSLAVLNVRSGACFGMTVGADGTPGTGEVVGRACPRMVMRGGAPRCGACGCPTWSLSDLREVIKSPGWGCGPDKMGKYLAMIEMEDSQ